MMLIFFIVITFKKGFLRCVDITFTLPVLDIKNFASLKNVKCNIRCKITQF